jgi:hypothetical protein
MPAFCDSDANIFPKPAFGDIKLSELNGNCPSAFNNSLIFSPSNALHPQETGTFSEQTAAGYSLDYSLGGYPSLIAWDETNFLSDSEIYLSLSSVPSLSYTDSLYTDGFSISTDEMFDALAQGL